jgi:putative hydrolase of the HAD superfamily
VSATAGTAIEVVVSDFGGVLTSPLVRSFAAFQDEAGVPLEALGAAMATVAEHDGANPLFELECGRMSEADFLARIGSQLSADLGRPVEMHTFSERYFAHLEPNAEMIAFLRELRERRGLRLALLTNNVREWEPRWRAMLPVDELFELVVDSAFVGMRKPDPEIYALTCSRLGVEPSACVFVDDFEHNCEAAREAGMAAVWFRDTAQAIAGVRAALDAAPAAPSQFSEPSRSQR